MSARALRPRATDRLLVQPALVTDRSAPAIVGLEGREFRALLVSEGIPHARKGQRVLARVDDVLIAIDRLASASPGAPSTDAAADDEGPGVDGVLARIGRKRTG